jgi:hypothetical protein
MGIDKLTFQKWIAGTEIKFHKVRTPLKKVPGVNQLSALRNYEQDYVLSERIDLTRASNFLIQENTEDFLVASISLPLFGKKVIGNDTGLALACFDYADREGDSHKVIGVCAYSISGVGLKSRDVRHSLAVPLKR